MLDRALATTFANLSTLLLVAFVFTIPIHVVQAYVFKDVLAVQELGPEIASFPEGRQVRGVAKGDFGDERNALLIALGLELILLPLAYRAARRVMEVDTKGGVPGVLDAWTHLGSKVKQTFAPGPTAVAGVIGVLAGLLVWLIGDMLADMVSADIAWALLGLGRAAAVAMFVAFVAGTAASTSGHERIIQPVEKLDLY